MIMDENKILNIQDNAIIKIDALDMERSASQPQFKSLLALGWRVVATIPVDDEGRPTIICILCPPKRRNKRKLDSIASYVSVLFLFAACVLLYLGL